MTIAVRQTGAAGFTLLELLVVVALIGIMITAVVLSVGDGGQQKKMENEARRLVGVIQLARDEAVLMSEELAMLVEDDYYDFQRFGKKSWEPLKDDRILKRHELQDGLQLVLEMESFANKPRHNKSEENSEEVELDKDDNRQVRVYFLSSGEVQPFTLYIEAPEVPDSPRFKVTVDQQGEVSWNGPLDETES